MATYYPLSNAEAEREISPMSAENTLRTNLADAQERAHARIASNALLYRLYTEDKANLTAIVSQLFPSATLIHTVGLWQGQLETGRIIEIVGFPSDSQRVLALARRIKTENKQDAVLVTSQSLSSQVI